MNAVDTGWVTDMAPGGLGAAARAHETFVGPPLDDEVSACCAASCVSRTFVMGAPALFAGRRGARARPHLPARERGLRGVRELLQGLPEGVVVSRGEEQTVTA